jgi:GT2 family glycosyltransferase
VITQTDIGRPALEVRSISVISPMRNEAAHIEAMLADMADQDFVGDVEIFVADGRSSDDSVARARAAAERHGLSLLILDNPHGWIPHGLNACIRRARGDLVVRLDCHARYPADYLRRCALAAEETGAHAVGGVLVSHGRTRRERAVGCAMDSPFGGIGWMRSASVRRETDMVTFGAFRPDAFALAGLFDESLGRNEDEDFTLRLRRRGGRVMLDPAIHVHYVPRGSLSGVFRQYYGYGLWKPIVMARHRRALSLRSLVPAVFVLSLALLAARSGRSTAARRLLAAELSAYAGGALGFALTSVRRRREPWRLTVAVATTFPAFHLGYGLGMWHGFVRLGLRRARRSGGADPRRISAAGA